MKLFRSRLIEVEAEINSIKELQQSLSTRGAVWFDSASSLKTEELVKNLEILYERKIALKKQINLYIEDALLANSTSEPGETYSSNYTFHNIKIIWNELVRNAIYKIIELRSKESQIIYCLSTVAARVVSGLVNGTQASPKNSAKIGKENKMRDVNYIEEDTKSLLKRLLNDLKMGVNLVVENETSELLDHVNLISKTASSDGVNRSSDPNSPNFVHSDHIVDLRSQWKFINPQVCLEIGSTKKQCLIIAAPKMQLSILKILNSESVNIDEMEKAELFIKSRTILNIFNAQFLTGNDSDDKAKKWPYWVQIESLVDSRILSSNLQRSSEQVTFSYFQDSVNPLYVSRLVETEDECDKYTVSCKQFKIQANQEQYFIWFDCINKLLMYSGDPESDQRAIHLKKMIVPCF
jgi:hypothetical protein